MVVCVASCAPTAMDAHTCFKSSPRYRFCAIRLWCPLRVFFFFFFQVLNNVAQIVLEETAPGSIMWLKWRNVLHVVDIICCCSILMPIIWSIRHLRQVREGDFRTAK